MARVLGAEDIGRFNYALALAGMFGVMFDFGVLNATVKELAQNPDGSSLRLYGRVKLLSSLAGLVLIWAVVFFTPVSLADRSIVIELGFYLALSDFSNYVVVAYRARGEFWRETAVSTAIAFMQLIACAVALEMTKKLELVVIGFIVAAAIGLAPLLYEWRKQPQVSGADQGLQGFSRAIRQCVPLAGTALVGTIYMNYDVVILGNNVAMEQVGWYSVAVKTIFGILIMPLNYFQLATLPMLASELGGDISATRNRWLQGFVLSTTVGALLSLCTAVLAGELLTKMFGPGFAAGRPVLVVFALIGFLFYLYTPISQWLLLLGRQKWTLYIQAAAMIANLALVTFIVPHFGVWGAVFAAGVTHLIIAVGHFVLAWNAGGFTRREAAWWSLLRVTLGITLAIAVLHLSIGSGIFSKVLAVGVFVICAHREMVELVYLLRSRLRFA